MVSASAGCDLVTMRFRLVPPGTPPGWMPGLTERDRYEWWLGDRDDPIEGLASFCGHYGLPVVDLAAAAGQGSSRYGLGFLVGAAACAAAAGARQGPPRHAAPYPISRPSCSTSPARSGPVRRGVRRSP